MRKISLYYHTLRHLTAKQLFYQLFYRAKRSFYSIHTYAGLDDNAVVPVECQTTQLIPTENKYLGDYRFRFLNLTHQFTDGVDWHYMENGKLWNYNLHYFDYILSEENKYQSDFAALISSYAEAILEGKIKLEPYPTSLRLINWILYVSKNGVHSAVIDKAIKRQTAYLRSNLEYHIDANHLLENFISLFIASHYIQSKELSSFVASKLFKELKKQITNDGAHYERSPMYHQIILSKLIICFDISKSSDQQVFLKVIIQKMINWMKAFQFRNQSFALFNDATVDIAPSADIIYREAFKLNIVPEPMKLKESGFRKYENEKFELVCNVGNITPSYQPGHAHADMLSFCCSIKERSVLIDLGISTYQPGSRREFERSTAAHNTVVVKSRNQSEVWSSFRVGKRAVLKIVEDSSQGCTAYHDGYAEIGLRHTRKFALQNDQIIVVDNLESRQECECIAHFYFDRTIGKPLLKADNVFAGNAVLTFSNSLSIEIFDYDQPTGYNEFSSAFACAVIFNKALKTVISENENFIYN